MATLEERPIPWQELLEVLFRQHRVVLVTALLGLSVAVAQVTLRPPLYTAKARIQLTAKGFSGPREEAMSDKQIQAELAFLKSPVLVRSVLEKQNREVQEQPPLDRSALQQAIASIVDFFPTQYRKLHGIPVADPLDRIAQYFASRMSVAPLERSNLIEISFSHTDPQYAARFVNDLIEQHKIRIAELEEQAQDLTFWDAKTIESADRLENARLSLDRFLEAQGPDLISRDEVQLKSVLGRLETERVATETKALETRAEIAFLTGELSDHPETVEEHVRVTENELANLINEQILELEMERTELLTRYTLGSTPVRQVDRQIDALKERLATTDDQVLAETTTSLNPARQQLDIDILKARSSLIVIEARLAALDSQISTYREKLRQLRLVSAEFERLRNEVETADQAHQTYLKEAEESRFERSLIASQMVNISFVDQAEVPGTAEPFNSRARTLYGVLIGLGIGVFLAFARDWLDPSIKSSAQAMRLTGAPIIAEIPP